MGKGNITGTPFLPAVTEQINKRQEFLGQNPKQDKHIIWQNNKSAFLRMASSVNVENEYKVAGARFSTRDEAESYLEEALLKNKLPQTTKVEEVFATTILEERGLPQSLKGNLLAKSSVLFSGINQISGTDQSPSPIFPQGVFTGNSLDISSTFGSAYGWGGLQQGYVPMPGINGADVSYYNRGALQKVTINCKLFSVEQLQVFDLLYFRIGYSMLLEWGHNVYVDNKGDLQNRNDYFTDPLNLFFGIGNTKVDAQISKQNQILQAIKNERNKSSYNYDAMLGKLTNFTWKFNTDGSYDVTLNLIGIGDVIESMKVNQSITIPGAPEAPSVTIAREGEKIATQQRASEQYYGAAKQGLANKQKEAAKIADTLTTESANRDKQWEQLYKYIPAYQKLSKFQTPPKTPAESQELENFWIAFKDEASVGFGGNRGTYKNAEGQDEKVQDFYPSDFPVNYINWRLENGKITFTNGKANNDVISRPSVANTSIGDFQYLQDIVTVGYTSPYGNTGVNVPAFPNSWDGGNFEYYGLVSGTKDYQSKFRGLWPQYADIYYELIKLNHQTRDDEGKQEKAQGVSAALQAEATQLDAQADAAEARFRDLTRAVEAKKERQEIAPEAAKESASKTKLNAILWGWIDYLTKTGDYDKKNYAKLEYKAKSLNSGETGVSEHQFTQFYVRFGYFLDWIQNNLLYYDINPILKTKGSGYPTEGSPEWNTLTKEEQDKIKKQQSDQNNPNPQGNQNQPDTKTQQSNLYKDQIAPVPDNAIPLFTIDTDIERNRCLAWRFQISADPFICLIPMDGVDSNNNGWKLFVGPESKLNLDEDKTYSYFVHFNSKGELERNRFQGKVMNIMVNIDYLAKALASNVDVNGKVNLLTYLNDICNNINDTLGNVNKLQAIYDSEENEVKIIDDNILKRSKESEPEVAVFESFGVSLPKSINLDNGSISNLPGKGSFLRNIDFQVQLPPSMASMATISAQAKGNIVGENATALSKLNDGLKDRVITYKFDAETLSAEEKGKSSSTETIFQENIKKAYAIITELYVKYEYQKDNVDTLRSINRDISLHIMGQYAEGQIAPAPFFIPFNLSLEMDGLSGMVNYQRFAIQEKILPYSYRPAVYNAGTVRVGKIDFLIKGISHSIKNNQWITKIDSLTVSAVGQRSTTYDTSEEEKFVDLSFLGNKGQQTNTNK